MSVSGYASMLGGPPPATITTSGSGSKSGIYFAGMMAKNVAAIIAALNVNNGSNNGGTRNRNISTITPQNEVINYWRQWVFCCFKLGVNLRHDSPGCPKKGPNHICWKTNRIHVTGSTRE